MLLFQFPPSFKLNQENLQRLKEGFKSLDPELNYAVEFRHNSWFTEPEIIALCQKFKVSFYIVSAPRIKFIPQVSCSNIYFRFHGVTKWYAYCYQEEELMYYAEIIKRLKKPSNKIWIYFNNDFSGYAPENAKLLRRLLAGQKTEKKNKKKSSPGD